MELFRNTERFGDSFLYMERLRMDDRFSNELLHSIVQGRGLTSVSVGFIKSSLFVSLEAIAHFSLLSRCYTRTHILTHTPNGLVS